MLTQSAVRSLNHVLGQQAWAQQRLVPFAGRTLEFRMSMMPTLRVTIGLNGLLENATAEAVPDLVITTKPSAIPYLLLRDEAVMSEVELNGSTDLAQVVRLLFLELEWDFEEDLSRVFGDVLAHRMASTGRSLFSWQRDAGVRLAQNFSEYWTEENPLIARRADTVQFGSDVERLRDDTERLEKRIERLQRQKGI